MTIYGFLKMFIINSEYAAILVRFITYPVTSQYFAQKNFVAFLLQASIQSNAFAVKFDDLEVGERYFSVFISAILIACCSIYAYISFHDISAFSEFL